MSLMGTAVSGMLGDTSWLSNISQNVANANTTGYKKAETEFATIVDQVGSATAAGGGVTASTRSLNSLSGSVVGTSTTTDLAIKGDGYFVVSDAGGVSDVVLDGRTGLVVPLGNPQALGMAVNRLVDMPMEQRRKLGEAAREHVVANFEMDLVVTRWESLYRELLAPWM